jgi:recombinational DNA repair protein (RecF pathway)
VATFAPEGEPAEKLYRLLDASVQALERGVPRALVLRYFEMWLLRLAGVFPPPDDCPHCGRPLVEGDVRLAASGEALLCGSCAGENPGALAVSGAALDFFRRAGRESPERLAESPPPARTLDEVEEIVGRIRRHFLQGEIRSYQVARRTIASLDEAGVAAPTPPKTRPGPKRSNAV